MNRVVFDIETLAFPVEALDEQQQEYLFRFAKNDEERADAIQKLSLTPFTAQVIAIGMINPDSNQGKVFFQSTDKEPYISEDGLVEFVPGEEKFILESFWKAIARFDQFITFNGRTFDCPFLLLRSTILGIKPTRNLVPKRFSAEESCDLMEQLTFYGAFRKFNLDFYCKGFGIKSPKSDGLTGLDLGPLYYAGRYKEIADYCLGDVKATGQLFHRWHDMLCFDK